MVARNAIFRYTVNSVSKFFMNSCICAQSDPENPYAETLMRKEKCAQCMTDPWKVP